MSALGGGGGRRVEVTWWSRGGHVASRCARCVLTRVLNIDCTRTKINELEVEQDVDDYEVELCNITACRIYIL